MWYYILHQDVAPVKAEDARVGYSCSCGGASYYRGRKAPKGGREVGWMAAWRAEGTELLAIYN